MDLVSAWPFDCSWGFRWVSEEWGASPGDVVANAAGTGLGVAVERATNYSKILFHLTDYALKDQVLGSPPERIIKTIMVKRIGYLLICILL
jgi:hypothetical protein